MAWNNVWRCTLRLSKLPTGQVSEAFCKGRVPSKVFLFISAQVFWEIGCRKSIFEERCNKNGKTARRQQLCGNLAVVCRCFSKIVAGNHILEQTGATEIGNGGKILPEGPKQSKSEAKQLRKGSQLEP